MVPDDRKHANQSPILPRCRSRQHGTAIPVVVLTLSASLAAITLPFLVFSQGQEPPRTGALEQNQFRAGDRLFSNWPKPDVALMISGQMIGYLQPCGCSEPQLGGLARRYNFMQRLRENGWNVVSADVGDIPQASGPEAQLKYKYAMMALKKMDYRRLNTSTVAFGALGLAFLMQGHISDAIAQLKEATRLNPDDRIAQGLLEKARSIPAR